MMTPEKNPTDDRIKEIIALSEHRAAKWLKDLETGDLWYWPADWTTHSKKAEELQVQDYDKGIVTLD